MDFALKTSELMLSECADIFQAISDFITSKLIL